MPKTQMAEMKGEWGLCVRSTLDEHQNTYKWKWTKGSWLNECVKERKESEGEGK